MTSSLDHPRELRFAAPKQRRAALVTGGARGLGRAMAIRIAAEGRDVVIADVLEEQGEQTVADITALGQRAIFCRTDVTLEAEVKAAAAAAVDAFKRLDILVCAAGVLGIEAPFHEQSAEQFAKVMAINVHGVFHAHQAAIAPMLEGGWGRCVTITSAARFGSADKLPYAVSKGAIFSLIQSLGNAYSRQGVFVNGVEPGRALTDMVVPRFSAEQLADPGNPLGRYSDPEEVGRSPNFCAPSATPIPPARCGASRAPVDNGSRASGPAQHGRSVEGECLTGPSISRFILFLVSRTDLTAAHAAETRTEVHDR